MLWRTYKICEIHEMTSARAPSIHAHDDAECCLVSLEFKFQNSKFKSQSLTKGE